MAERRMEGVRLLEKGNQSQAEIARTLGVSEAAVCVWAKKLREHGKGSLKLNKASGRPSGLSTKDKATLLAKMKAGAIAAGFETERWTQARVQKMIAKEFGVHYHQNYISRLLHDLGWSVQQPETRAMERDEELIRAWLSKDWNRIKKSAAARRRSDFRR
ncbi:MAG: transposase [Chloroflexi bacterium]|nr:transposase [Chloroflexota bacterium]